MSFYADYAAGAMTGSVQKNMNAKVIVACQFRWPGRSAMREFAEAAGRIRATLNQKVHENERLTELRDGLLPELLSGRIRVPEARDVVEPVS